MLAKIAESVECSVCSDIMIVPVISSCGHSFCYECCTSWFENKATCPTCRHELEAPPTLNVQLKEISSHLVDTLIDHGDDSEKQELINRRDTNNQQYQDDAKNGILYGETFKNVLTIVDKSDGVPRCGNCHWEAHGSECLHCGAVFRIPRDDDEYDSAEAYDEDHLEEQYYGAEDNAYDSNDSFIDGRELNDINGDIDDENDILSDMDTNSNRDSWRGFDQGNDGNLSDGEIHELSSEGHFSDDGYHHYHSMSDAGDYEDDGLETALESFHAPVSLDLDDEDVQPSRRRVVIDISDDE